MSDRRIAYGGSFPDVPGISTAADELNDLPAMAQQAVLAMYLDADEHLPHATSIDHWRRDAQFRDGFWVMVEINPQADHPAAPGPG
ncbi:type II toxin-antitoxin system HicB family antitoxin [Duganella sp. BuS-21]|uniref:type II toxin-antitoxin system HicB family antitoxin n=1 Tax=Duganella sp. BuS-21 TaxID=2943848 RepID=UPI0035A63F3F